MTKSHQFEMLCKGIQVPGKTLFTPILMHFAAQLTGKNYGEFASDNKVLVEANMKALEIFDVDMLWLISDPYREASAFGAPVRFIPDGVPLCEKKLISDREDVKNLKNPDVHKSPRTADRLKAVTELYRLSGGNIPLIGWVEGPLASACNLTGVSEMLMFLMTDPTLSNKLLDKCLITAKDFAKAQVEAGCDIIGVGDAICSQIDSLTYAEFVKERHRDLFRYIHSLGAKVKLHICGDISHLLEEICTTEPDILDLDWQVDFRKAASVMIKGTIFCGNINPVVIQDKNADQIFAISSALIRENEGLSWILSGGCEITVGTAHQNLKAMRNASK